MTSVLTTLVAFNGINNTSSLIADANGDLFGTTWNGGADVAGTVFEIVNTGSGYASTPTTLVSFTGANGANPYSSLIADANGDLFGTTTYGGANGDGTVFEIAKSGGSYASTPTTLVSFNYANGGYLFGGPLIADANGDLFGTTEAGGASGYGTVFEIAKSGGSYATTPTTLVSFNYANGGYLYSGLIADANGDLFGTTFGGGASGYGTVFEIAKSGGSYASTPTTLVSFTGANGAYPHSSLIADANGDLFGTTDQGGASGYGTVFEIAKSGGSYASTPTTLVSFTGANGGLPDSSLIADGNGDLFGTTQGGGTNGDGTVFEIAKSGSGYATTPTTLVSFTGANGDFPAVSLIADANGDLFGTTENGSANGWGTVFEITGSGFVTRPVPPPVLSSASSPAMFFELRNPVQLAPSLHVSDVSSSTLASASVSITAGTFPNDRDVLAAVTIGTNIIAEYDTATETLNLSGVDTLSNYQRVLESATFSTSSTNPANSGADFSRTVTWTVNDGINTSAPITTSVNINVLGLDTSSNITTLPEARAIKDAGYQFVATYIGAHRPLTRKEANLLAEAGLQIVTIYENKFMADTNFANGNYTRIWELYFSTADAANGQSIGYMHGYNDAKNIYDLLAPTAQGRPLGQPFGSPIYFAVDLDPASPLSRISTQTALDGIAQYFQGVNAFLDSLPPDQRYSVGIYGDSVAVEWITRQQFKGQALATYSWISTSWSDSSLGGNWNLWQLDTHLKSNTFNLSLPGGSINIDTDFASTAQGSFGGWTPSTPVSTNVSSVPNVIPLVQAMASFGVHQGGQLFNSTEPSGSMTTPGLFAGNLLPHHG